MKRVQRQANLDFFMNKKLKYSIAKQISRVIKYNVLLSISHACSHSQIAIQISNHNRIPKLTLTSTKYGKGATTGGSGDQDPLNIFIDPPILDRAFYKRVGLTRLHCKYSKLSIFPITRRAHLFSRTGCCLSRSSVFYRPTVFFIMVLTLFNAKLILRTDFIQVIL